MERTFSYAEVRSAVLQQIRLKPKGDVVIREGLFYRFIEQGRHPTPGDLEAAREVFHELYLEGVIIPGAGINSSHAMSWPFYCVSQYGVRLLSNPDYEPHDQDGYIAKIRIEIPAIDGVILRYLEEALECFRANQRGQDSLAINES